MRIAVVQNAAAWHDRSQSHREIDQLLGSDGADLIVLPETFDTGWTMDRSIVADDMLSRRYLASLARRTGAHVIAGIACDDAGVSRNRAVWFDRSGLERGAYDKIHLFSPANEQLHYAPGDRVVVWDVEGMVVAPMICYDLRFPERFREAIDLGAEAFVVVANFPAQRVDAWVTLACARAIENQAWVIAANRAGSDPNVSYPGASMVVDPTGAVVERAGAAACVLHATIDPQAARDWRARFPALRDRVVPQRRRGLGSEIASIAINKR
jgi:predicted amidohydrolase